MTASDFVRRALTVLAVAACLLVVSGAAEAKFTGSSSAAVQVGTASMVAPTAVTGKWACRSSVLTEGTTFTVTGFVDAGPAGASYHYQVFRNQGTTAVYTMTSTTRSATVATPTMGVDGAATTWTLTVHAVLGNWTSQVWSKTITCPALSAANGNL
ncbi:MULTISPECIES: hypothetical protein [unclassified Nocardioides]|uniref:hypothetical protein n=1 Tax=unclassified Nocardioides TaxID=2615069 RepID=UPI000702D6B0|nr:MULTISPECIES: hypothetical protein [unclassified Nocardioides]KQZ67304.1 hypothetical protein ASD66_20280 [Nocardioides sp. Root151]KRF12618.1 hypothetical protein ASH02_13780 [Nocardioides sp. Soil796]